LLFLLKIVYFLSFVVLVLDRDTAFNKLLTLDGFGIGNSRANSLFWAATRAPPVPGFNATKVVPTTSKNPKVSCTANSACDAQGMLTNSESILMFCYERFFSRNIRNDWRLLPDSTRNLFKLLSENLNLNLFSSSIFPMEFPLPRQESSSFLVNKKKLVLFLFPLRDGLNYFMKQSLQR
jgi:hypothetical protein